jgi:hypothetical protein
VAQEQKRRESRLGRRSPKRLPTKFLPPYWSDVYDGVRPGRKARVFVRRARLREAREAWRIEHED